MPETTEEAVLLALDNRQEMFDSLHNMLRSDNYVKVLMSLEEGQSQTEIADEIGVGNATVSRAVRELLEYELIEEAENGYRKSLPVLDHPIIQYFYEKEVLNNE